MKPRFAKNAIDAEILPKLTAEDVKEHGVASVGHRRKLLAAIATYPAGNGPSRFPFRRPIAFPRRAIAMIGDSRHNAWLLIDGSPMR
jgi:hypothetical protein